MQEPEVESIPHEQDISDDRQLQSCLAINVPFVTLILGRVKIMRLFRGSHGVPDGLALLVFQHVVQLGEDEEDNVCNDNTEQDAITSMAVESTPVSKDPIPREPDLILTSTACRLDQMRAP